MHEHTCKHIYMYTNIPIYIYTHVYLNMYVFQSGPENPSGNFVFLYSKSGKFVGADVFAFFRFGRV